jgi:hypothetical protein
MATANFSTSVECPVDNFPARTVFGVKTDIFGLKTLLFELFLFVVPGARP